MARRRTRGAMATRRLTDWQNGFLTVAANATAADTLTNFVLNAPFNNGPKVTLVRIIGEVHSAIAPTSLCRVLNANLNSTLHMGIQIVPRAQNTAGTPRDPSVVDDQEGSWLWKGSRWHSWMVTDPEGCPPDWYLPTHSVGSDNPHLDIKVKRKIDLSQDQLLLSMHPVGNNTGLEWLTSINLRLLFLES